MPACCDFSRMQQVYIFLAFMTSILYLSSRVPSLNALYQNDTKWEELTRTSVLVWRTVKLLANKSNNDNKTPNKPSPQIEQKTLYP